MSKPETIVDIIADIIAQNRGLPEDAYAISPHVGDMLNLADRLIAAYEREKSSALAAPPRNCDVGTVEEQAQRFNDYCTKQGDGCCIVGGKGACPIFKGYRVDCGIVWAQMPYESEVAK